MARITRGRELLPAADEEVSTTTTDKSCLGKMFSSEWWLHSLQMPDTKLRSLLTVMVFLITVWNAAIIPMRMVFPRFGVWVWWYFLDYTLDAFLMVDIASRFLMGYEVLGVVVPDRALNAFHYLTTNFVFDVFCVLPAFAHDPKLHALLRINRIGLLYRVPSFFHRWERATSRPVFYRIIKLILGILAMAHWIACIFFYIVKLTDESNNGNWPDTGDSGWAQGLENYIDAPTIQPYLRALFWSTTLLTGMGPDHNYPQSELELSFTFLVLMSGVVLFAAIIGNVGSLIANSSATKADHKKKMDIVNLWMRHKGIAPILQARIRAYYEYLWQRQAGLNDQIILMDFPEHLRALVSDDLNKNILREVPMFKALSNAEPFIQALMSALRPEIYTPGDAIVRENEMGQSMFFITRGIVDVVTIEFGRVAQLGEGRFFGEKAVLFKAKRNASIIARTYVDVFVLEKTDVDSALTDFPLYADELYSKAAEELMKKQNKKEDEESDEDIQHLADRLEYVGGKQTLGVTNDNGHHLNTSDVLAALGRTASRSRSHSSDEGDGRGGSSLTPRSPTTRDILHATGHSTSRSHRNSHNVHNVLPNTRDHPIVPDRSFTLPPQISVVAASIRDDSGLPPPQDFFIASSKSCDTNAGRSSTDWTVALASAREEEAARKAAEKKKDKKKKKRKKKKKGGKKKKKKRRRKKKKIGGKEGGKGGGKGGGKEGGRRWGKKNKVAPLSGRESLTVHQSGGKSSGSGGTGGGTGGSTGGSTGGGTGGSSSGGSIRKKKVPDPAPPSLSSSAIGGGGGVGGGGVGGGGGGGAPRVALSHPTSESHTSPSSSDLVTSPSDPSNRSSSSSSSSSSSGKSGGEGSYGAPSEMSIHDSDLTSSSSSYLSSSSTSTSSSSSSSSSSGTSRRPRQDVVAGGVGPPANKHVLDVSGQSLASSRSAPIEKSQAQQHDRGLSLASSAGKVSDLGPGPRRHHHHHGRAPSISSEVLGKLARKASMSGTYGADASVPVFRAVDALVDVRSQFKYLSQRHLERLQTVLIHVLSDVSKAHLSRNLQTLNSSGGDDMSTDGGVGSSARSPSRTRLSTLKEMKEKRRRRASTLVSGPDSSTVMSERRDSIVASVNPMVASSSNLNESMSLFASGSNHDLSSRRGSGTHHRQWSRDTTGATPRRRPTLSSLPGGARVFQHK